MTAALRLPVAPCVSQLWLLLLLLDNCVASTLEDALWILRVGEELHRTFRMERGVKVLMTSDIHGHLCARQFLTSAVSRKQYEESWTSVRTVANRVEAVFNGSCFTQFADSCVKYLECQEPSQRYPTVVDALGTSHFVPETAALRSSQWAEALASVEAWMYEQDALQAQLTQAPDDSSEQASYIRDAIWGAATTMDQTLRFEDKSLITLARQRTVDFKQFVRPETGPTPVQGSAELPVNLQGLAEALERVLLQPGDTGCLPDADFITLREQLRTSVGASATAVGGINALALLQPKEFDFAWRAVEAMVVGAALTLQAAALSGLMEFVCRVRLQPRGTEVPNLSALQETVRVVLGQVSDALPAPANGEAPSAPLQHCLSDRVQSAVSAVSAQAAARGGAARPLLSLDFCRRLFDAGKDLVIQVVPHRGAAPAASAMTFSSASGEERKVHMSNTGHFAYMSPYMDVVQRPTADMQDLSAMPNGAYKAAAFASDDKVLKLKRMDDANVQAKGSLPRANRCSPAELTALMEDTKVQCDGSGEPSAPCSVPGCYREGYWCYAARGGYYTTDGKTLLECPKNNLPQEEALFYARAWHNETCPFVCHLADRYRSDRTCESASSGFYSPTCSNDRKPCEMPPGLPDGLFCALASFTTPGNGDPRGCEATLASPLAKPLGEDLLMPPFTVELWVQVRVSDLPSLQAVLMGSFPIWFVSLRKVSSTAVQIGFWHHHITRAVSSRQDSIVYSRAITWSRLWCHVAVVVTSLDASTPNVQFYSDGELVSSAQRSAVTVPLAPVHPCLHNVFHVGAPNMRLSPEVLHEGRTEPYFDVPPSELFYEAQIDEVRVSLAALDGFTQGAHLTELRRQASCNTPYEALLGSTCQPIVRLTSAYTEQGQSQCKTGFEICSARPGLCVRACTRGTLRQPDCTCDCPPKKFQSWFAQALHLTGSGSVGNITVYDTAHGVTAHIPRATLPYRINLNPPQQVAVLTVRGTGSAKSVSLHVESATGQRMQVPEHRNTLLHTDRETILHHRRVHEFFDPTSSCASCPGDVGVALGSKLPRMDATSCSCSAGHGRDLLGKCIPLREPLPNPTISPGEGFFTAGTRVSLLKPGFFGQGPWLLEVRYTLNTNGGQPGVPRCSSALLYEEATDGTTPGLDIVRRQAKATLCAVTCHPMHQDSQVACATFTGNEHMNPPRCILNGTASTDSTYSLEVGVIFTVDDQPDASLHYRLAGSQQSDFYSGPLLFNSPGTTQLEVWATKQGFDQSATASCRFTIDGAARLTVALAWPEATDPKKTSQLGGFVHSESAFLVRRSVGTLRFQLQAQVPGGATLATADVEHRLVWGSQKGEWQQVAVGGSVELGVQELLQPSFRTTVLLVEWRAKEVGYVWSNPVGMRFLIVANRTGIPTLEATRTQPWGVSDSWLPGRKRDIALRQVHRVELHPPTASARLLFKLGTWQQEHPLLEVSSVNVSSLRSNGLVEQFRSISPSPDWGPDVLPGNCGPELRPASLPRFCEYLGPFEVLAGAQVSVFALDNEQLESSMTVTVIPRELPPPEEDPRFEATVQIMGPRVSVTSLPGVFVLPSTETAVTFSLSPAGVEKQSCVLASQFSYKSASIKERPLQLSDCTWLAYNGPRRLLLKAQQEATGIAMADSVSLNITVLTTLRQPGYLWAFPRSQTFLWLRESTPPPSIVGVIEPGRTALVSAMVWLRSEIAGDSMSQNLASHTSGTGLPRCYFTLHNVPVLASELPQPWLVAVPQHTSSVQIVRDAVRPTMERLDARPVESWRANLRLCAWPSICELPLNGTLPAALIQAPADLPRLCAWALWHGYGASPPACELMGPEARVKQARLDFTFDGNLSAQQSAGSQSMVFPKVVKVGYDDILDADVVVLEGGSNPKTSGRMAPGLMAGQPAGPAVLSNSGLPLFLERTHPVQYRYAAVPLDPNHIPQGADNLIRASDYCPWEDLDVSDPTPVVPLPQNRRTHEHTLFAVDVRLLIGIGRWGQQSRTLVVALQGIHPAAIVEQHGRTLNVTSPRPNSTLLFRWTPEAPEDLLTADGGALLRLQTGFRSIAAAAYGLEPGVRSRLLPPGTPPAQCLASSSSAGQAELRAEAAQGPRLCSSGGPVELHAPDSQQWNLWVASFGPGLALSSASHFVVQAQCLVPDGIGFADTPPCLEGSLIDSGAACSPRCLEGHTPSAASLTCSGGRSSSVAFTCSESRCSAPENITHAAALPCGEGRLIASGAVCIPQCERGYTPLGTSLSCRKGKLSPSTFLCTEAPCAAPSIVVHAADPSCSGLKTVASGATCTPQCQEGYVPSVPQLACTKGDLSPPAFSCEEAGCVAPSMIRYAKTPACAEGDRVDPGGSCTPQCKNGYTSSVSLLTCSKGALSPDAFTCVEALSAAGMNIAPLLAGSMGGLVVVGGIFALLCCCHKTLMPAPHHEEAHELRDALQEWWQCVKEVEPGICVFCGKTPVSCEFEETDHGPLTIFRCCSDCSAVLPLHGTNLGVTLEGSEPEGEYSGDGLQVDDKAVNTSGKACEEGRGSHMYEDSAPLLDGDLPKHANGPTAWAGPMKELGTHEALTAKLAEVPRRAQPREVASRSPARVLHHSTSDLCSVLGSADAPHRGDGTELGPENSRDRPRAKVDTTEFQGRKAEAQRGHAQQSRHPSEEALGQRARHGIGQRDGDGLHEGAAAVKTHAQKDVRCKAGGSFESPMEEQRVFSQQSREVRDEASDRRARLQKPHSVEQDREHEEAIAVKTHAQKDVRYKAGGSFESPMEEQRDLSQQSREVRDEASDRRALQKPHSIDQDREHGEPIAVKTHVQKDVRYKAGRSFESPMEEQRVLSQQSREVRDEASDRRARRPKPHSIEQDREHEEPIAVETHAQKDVRYKAVRDFEIATPEQRAHSQRSCQVRDEASDQRARRQTPHSIEQDREHEEAIAVKTHAQKDVRYEAVRDSESATEDQRAHSQRSYQVRDEASDHRANRQNLRSIDQERQHKEATAVDVSYKAARDLESTSEEHRVHSQRSRQVRGEASDQRAHRQKLRSIEQERQHKEATAVDVSYQAARDFESASEEQRVHSQQSRQVRNEASDQRAQRQKPHGIEQDARRTAAPALTSESELEPVVLSRQRRR